MQAVLPSWKIQSSINFSPDNTAKSLHVLGWNLQKFTSHAQGGVELNRIPSGFTEAELKSESGLQAISVGLFYGDKNKISIPKPKAVFNRLTTDRSKNKQGG